MYFKPEFIEHTFTLQQFVIHQEHCAMKVGTDGVLLGAWAACPATGGPILDVGTGTGLIALMMAQRCPEAVIKAVEIDPQAASQARENISRAKRSIEVVCARVQDYHPGMLFDAIVCNPPFYTDAISSGDEQRDIARHTDALSYSELINAACRLLNCDGSLSVIIPAESVKTFDGEAAIAGLSTKRRCAVKTTATKPPKRYLMEYTKAWGIAPAEETLVIGDSYYQELTKHFYLTQKCH